jgi:hypothetical protein
MRQMATAGLLEYACDWVVPTQRYTFEFFVAMRPESRRDVVVDSWRAAQDLLIETDLAPTS